jgi:hypothetical protein
MLRFSTLLAALVLIASATFDASPARAVVCSHDTCVHNCFRAGGKTCLRGCDRRIARRISNGLCPWLFGSDRAPGLQAQLATQ